jgi:aminoglycoside 3-N-acetyltransferase
VSQEQELVKKILCSLPVAEDAVLLVHSAIRGLSHQGYRAEALIEAMITHVSSGTLLMPTMTWRTVTPANPVWDEMATPSHTGIMSEIFRTGYATHRSLHPTHSVAGWGKHAQVLLAGHHLGTTPVPATSPYGLMRDYPSYILLLGVDLETCTSIHHPEEMVAPDLYVKPIEESEPYSLRTRNGSLLQYRLRRHPRLPRDFLKFHPDLIARGMSSGNQNGVKWELFRLADLMQIVFSRLIEDPRATLS